MAIATDLPVMEALKVDVSFASDTVASPGTPIANGAIQTASMLLVPDGGAGENVSVEPDNV